jgi:hypothetical protein
MPHLSASTTIGCLLVARLLMPSGAIATGQPVAAHPRSSAAGRRPEHKPASPSERSIQVCLWNAQTFCLPDDANASVDVLNPYYTLNGIALRVTGAGSFQILRHAKLLYSFRIADFFNQNGVVIWAPQLDAFAINYSDGGAIGNFHVRLFTVTEDKVVDVTKAIAPAVADFKSRHYCKARGNNVTALKWVKDSRHLLLLTEVYPTGDCAELGYFEGYLVTVPQGAIQKRLTEAELRRFPGVCLENPEE